MGSRKPIELDDLNFDKEILETDTPVLVDFTASRCGPRKRLTPVVDDIAEETAGKGKVAKLDVDEAPAAAKRLGVRGLPTVIAFPNGEPRGRHVGVIHKKTLLALVHGRSRRSAGSGAALCRERRACAQGLTARGALDCLATRDAALCGALATRSS